MVFPVPKCGGASKEMDETGQFVNAVKAAELLRLSYKTMLRWIKAGRIRVIEKRYDYENAEFLIPLEEVERLRVALTLSQRELVTRFLKLELDALDMSRRVIQAETELRDLRNELGRLQHMVTLHIGVPLAEESSRVHVDGSEQQHQSRPFDLVRPTLGDEVLQSDLTPGSVCLTAFFREHGMPTSTGLDHLTKAQIEPMLLNRGAKDGSKERWLTPEQQGTLIINWDSTLKVYRRCEDCPH